MNKNYLQTPSKGRLKKTLKSELVSSWVNSRTQEILESLWKPDLTIVEWLNRKVPIFDVHHIVNILIYSATATLLHYMANEWWDPDNWSHIVHKFFNDATPKWWEDIINNINERVLFFLKWWNYGEWAVLGLLSSISVFGGLLSGAIPWRWDQLGFRKAHKVAIQNRIKGGTFPYLWSHHTVWIGMRDNLSFARIGDGKTFMQAIKSGTKGWEFVMIHGNDNDGNKMWDIPAIWTKLNSQWIYISYNWVQEEWVPRAENYLPAILSWAYKAENVVANLWKGTHLFWEHIVDNEQDGDRQIGISRFRHILRQACELRSTVCENMKKLKVAVIVPQGIRQKAVLDQERDGLSQVIDINFRQKGKDYELFTITPEKVFIDMLVEKIRHYRLESKTIYIDTEGTNIKWAQLCKKMLQEWLSDIDVVTSLEELEEENRKDKDIVWVLLREKNSAVWASSTHSIKSRNMTHIFYPQTTQNDVVQHDNDEDNWKRIPLPYLKVLWEKINKWL